MIAPSTRSLPLAVSLSGVSMLFVFVAAAPAQILNKTLTYSRFAGPPNNVLRVVFTYDAGLSTVGFGPRIPVASLPGADGLLFAPDGHLIVGGQTDAVHRVDPVTGTFTSVTTGGGVAFHVMLDPSGLKIWTASDPIPGTFADVPILPVFANGTQHAIGGDDPGVTHLAFVGNQAFYTLSLPTGPGNFGTFDVNTLTTTRLAANVPWAHGMTLDCFTGDLIAYANNSVAQIDPVSHAVVSLLDTSALGHLELDQGTSDGDGRLYIASNTGHMLFIDLTASGLVGSPANFVAAPFLDAALDDIAPDCGLGAPPTCPLTQGYWKNHPEWPLTTLTLGCQTYTEAQCLALLKTPTGNGNQADASVILAKQLIAAKLNVANNAQNWPLIGPVIAEADALLCTFAGALPYQVPSSTATGQQMVSLAGQLDAFNNGAAATGCGN